MSQIIKSALGVLVASSAAFAVTAVHAQSVKVKCETRADRSKASVDGKGLAAGAYTALLVSGANSAQSKAAQNAMHGEAQFDFDSNPRDVQRGATEIAPDFLGTSATGSIIDANGAVVATATAKCKAR